MITSPKELVDKVLVDGTADALSIYDALRIMQSDLEQHLARLKPAAMAELAKHGKDGVTLGDLHYSIRSTGGRWKYDHIPSWQQANEQQKLIEARAKAAYKAIEGGIPNMADDNGEIIEPARYTPGAETIFAEKKVPA